MTDLLPLLLAEHQPSTTLERHLTEQLANVLRKQATAEEGETFLLDNGPQCLLTHRPDGHLVPDPAYLIYNNRLDAMRLHQARLGREQSRIPCQLHQLKRTPLVPELAREPRSRAAAPKMSWVADIMADFDREAAEASEPGSLASRANEPKPASARAANELGSAAFRASEPTNAFTRAANEPTTSVASPRLDREAYEHGTNAAHPDPLMARSSRAKAEGARTTEAANEPGDKLLSASESTHAPTPAANEPAATPSASRRPDRATAEAAGPAICAAANEPSSTASGASEPGRPLAAAAKEPHDPIARAPAREPGDAAPCASEPTAHVGLATPNEPRLAAATTARAASEPRINPSRSPLASARQPVAAGFVPGSRYGTPGLKERLASSTFHGTPANEPKKSAYTWPVLSDADADRIEAMIHSGDANQLEEAARLLGIMDPGAPVPPHIVALYQSKLAG